MLLESVSRNLSGPFIPLCLAYLNFGKLLFPLSFEFPPRNHHLGITVRSNISILAWEVRIMSLHINCKGEGVLFPVPWLMLSYHYASAHIKAVIQGKIYPLQNQLILQILFRKPFGTSIEFNLKTLIWNSSNAFQLLEREINMGGPPCCFWKQYLRSELFKKHCSKVTEFRKA